MLRYEAAWLVQWYGEELLSHPGVPYVRIGGLGPYEISRAAGEFHLTQVVDVRPRLAYDETVVRLAGYEAGERCARLWVQPCAYSDGVKSNYAMDGPGELRETLRAEYGRRLPRLEDARLSNGIGTAVVVFDAAGRPYLPRRAPGQSVFPGQYHCTASGEAVWQDWPLTFENLFLKNICRELEEEVGLGKADLEWIRPLAFCREFLRAGKPQFFFAARTRLGRDELTVRRRAAIERQIEAGRQEVMDDVAGEVAPELCTIECWANLVFAGWER